MYKENFAISFCIVCMNRLHQLKETLLQNIKDNEGYDNLEFVVLNYNSQDGMDEWVKEHLSDYISTGKVNYYKTSEPKTFSHSHSKNLMFKLAKGDIVCNVNADNYTGKDFARYINEKFTADNNIVLTPIDFYLTREDHQPTGDVMGRVCVQKKDFLKVKGFNEQMKVYGFEDSEFLYRLEIAGVKMVLIDDFSFLQYIGHFTSERYEVNNDTIDSIYIHYGTTFQSEIIFLFNNGQFERCTLVDNVAKNADNYEYAYKKENYLVKFSIKEPGIEKGSWQTHKNMVSLYAGRGNVFSFQKMEIDGLTVLQDTQTHNMYYPMKDPQSIRDALEFNVIAPNQYIFEKNLKDKIVEGNAGEYGKGTVCRNFGTTAILV